MALEVHSYVLVPRAGLIYVAMPPLVKYLCVKLQEGRARLYVLVHSADTRTHVYTIKQVYTDEPASHELKDAVYLGTLNTSIGPAMHYFGWTTYN